MRRAEALTTPPDKRAAEIRSGAVDEQALQEINGRIVEVAQPERIILFGSAARGEMGHDSDVDLLVLKRGEFDQGNLLGDIYMHLIGVGQAVDVVVATPEEAERYRNSHALIFSPALKEGKVVHNARTTRAIPT